ncbi:Transposase [Arthrobacter sp. VKM Ac-2550]|nr:transposase [Arthrobacter sp. VKM Ac-2550]MCW2132052.1 Transposase [Arthrobacter sp. VKM Ac-2550]
MFESTSVGLDVHARSVAACALDSETGEIIRQTLAPDGVTAWLEQLPGTYEAGPTGFWLARTLAAAGIDCQVAAPSRLLRAPGDRIKTDKRDALSLARMLRLGEIVSVRVPTPGQEAARDLSRAHAVAVKDLTHARQRINAMLLRQGIVYPEDSHWTREHTAWLGRQRFEQPAAQAVFVSQLEAELLAVQRRKSLDKLVARRHQGEYDVGIQSCSVGRGKIFGHQDEGACPSLECPERGRPAVGHDQGADVEDVGRAFGHVATQTVQHLGDGRAGFRQWHARQSCPR